MAARKAFFGDFFAQALIHRDAYRLVQIALPAFQFDRADNLRLGRQFGGDIFLAATHDEGLDALRQQIAAQGVAVFLDRRAPGLGKSSGIAQHAGQQKVKLRPQLAQVIFQRSAGKT